MTTPALRKALLVVTSCAVLATGCNRERAAPADQNAVAAFNDEQLATYVRARYQRDSSLRANDISVSAASGVVTLQGAVHDANARDHAAQLARQVKGVQTVDNQLQVRTPEAAEATASERLVDGGVRRAGNANDSISPGWLTTKIQAQYFVNPEVRPWNIDVTTDSDGSVTLRGEVEEAADREEAARVARETAGVTHVDNQLRVRGATTGHDADDSPDEWITAKVQAKYFMDADVRARNINVATRDGIVTLTGEVDGEGERRQALALARNTDGVKSVTDRLHVERTDAKRAANETEKSARDTDVGIDDIWVTTIVQAKFFLDDDMKGRDIIVDARDGVVYLKGTVQSDAERRIAETIALETNGVSRVENQLTVDRATGRR